MKNKQLYILLGVLIVLLGAYLLFHGSREVRKSKVEVNLAIDQDKLYQIVLENQKDTLHFKRQDEKTWLLEDYPLEKFTFENFLKTITSLQADRLVSSNPARYPKYGVDSSATLLRLLDKEGNELLALRLGKRGATYRETFVRPENSLHVVAVPTNLVRYESVKKSYFWDKTMLQFDPQNVSKAEFNGKFNYVLTNTPEGWKFNGQPADSAKVVRLLSEISHYRASNFSTDPFDSTRKPVEEILITLADDNTQEIAFYKLDNKQSVYQAVVKGKSKVFEFSKARVDRLNKTYKDFRPEEKKQNSSKSASSKKQANKAD